MKRTFAVRLHRLLRSARLALHHRELLQVRTREVFNREIAGSAFRASSDCGRTFARPHDHFGALLAGTDASAS